MPGGIKGRPPGARAGIEARHITHPHHRPPGAREPGHRADQVAQGKADHSSHAPQQPSVQQSKAHRPRLGTARQGHQEHGSKADHEAKRSVKHKTP